MQIPDKIKIGVLNYQIKRLERLDVGNPLTLGYIDYVNNIIYIRAGLSPDEEAETLLHEIIHGINIFMRIRMEEDDVERLSRGLYLVLKENGLLE